MKKVTKTLQQYINTFHTMKTPNKNYSKYFGLNFSSWVKYPCINTIWHHQIGHGEKRLCLFFQVVAICHNMFCVLIYCFQHEAYPWIYVSKGRIVARDV